MRSPLSPRGTGLQNRRFQVRVLGAPLILKEVAREKLLQFVIFWGRGSDSLDRPDKASRLRNRPVRVILTIANRSHGLGSRTLAERVSLPPALGNAVGCFRNQLHPSSVP